MSVLTKPLDPLSEARICLPHVNWQQYETLIAMFSAHLGLRLAYKSVLPALRQQGSN